MTRIITLLALASTACGLTSTYQPANVPQARIVAEDGEQFVVVGGDRRPIGGLLDELDVALREVPAAAELAVQANDIATRGVILTLVGVALAVGGVITFASGFEIDGEGDAFGSREAIGLGVFTVGFGLELYGATLTPRAAFLANDAINLYNDAIWARQAPASAWSTP